MQPVVCAPAGHNPDLNLHTWLATSAQYVDCEKLALLLSTLNDLSHCSNVVELHRTAVEFSRTRLGLERVGLFLTEHQPNRILLRGTFGTDLNAIIIDEHRLRHEFWPEDYRHLHSLNRQGKLWHFSQQLPLSAHVRGRMHILTKGWLAVTPLISEGDLLGVLYNDAALSAPSSNQLAAATATD